MWIRQWDLVYVPDELVVNRELVVLFYNNGFTPGFGLFDHQIQRDGPVRAPEINSCWTKQRDSSNKIDF